MADEHARPAPEILKELDTGPEGLSRREAAGRLREQGPNALAAPARPLWLLRLLGQLKDPMILVLLAAAGLSLWASGGRDWLDGAIILVIVMVNAILSLSQEDQAQRALEELQQLTAPQARVLREGEVRSIPAAELVVGDILLLEAGDQVAADGRLLDCVRLQCDESAMTGESAPVEKALRDALPPDTPMGDRVNMVLSGTLVTAGRGRAVVTATGMDTQMGHIAHLLSEKQEEATPLQKRMAAISRVLSLGCAGICALMFVLGLLRGRPVADMFLTAVSLGVAAIPEGLPATVTVVLALGVQRMARKGAIVKKLPAVETLGCAGVICSDKTGTLTQNKMTVRSLWTLPGGTRREACVAAALCTDVVLTWKMGKPFLTGDPTECALVGAALEEGVDRETLEEEQPRTGELPFDSGRKLMSTLHARPGGGWTVYVKGAPDVLLDRCVRGPGGPLTDRQREQIRAANGAMAGKALRVIGVASRRLELLPSQPDPKAVESGLTFLGLFGLMDPPRPEVREAVRKCHRAGIRPVMITGDHRETALAVARELDILRPGDLSLTGPELDFLPQEVLEEEIDRFSVFARVSPEHKMRIVRAWQGRGQVVAMTGDGVNDAPGLKAAHIGCAMGKTGTEVAKGAADMILTDDNFSTIVSAVEEGRGIYANIRKAIHYLLSCNLGEILTLFTATALDLPQAPLVPVQLLWLNLVTDSLPALALGMEPVEPEAMTGPPRDPGEGFFTRQFSLRLLWQGLMVGLLTLCAYFWGFLRSPEAANTMAFATLTLSQLFHAFNIRSEDRPLFSLGGPRNPAMGKAFLTGLVLQMAVLLLPPLQGVFSVVPLRAGEWATVFLLAFLPIPICEGEKRWRMAHNTSPIEEAALK